MRVCLGEIFFLSWILETLKEVVVRAEGGNLPAVSRRWGDGPHKSSLGIGHSRWCLCSAPTFVVGAQLCFLTESFGASYFTCLSLTFLSCKVSLEVRLNLNWVRPNLNWVEVWFTYKTTSGGDHYQRKENGCLFNVYSMPCIKLNKFKCVISLNLPD